MPKDIRSYFTSNFKSEQAPINNEQIKNNRKRKKAIVLSDSDDEIFDVKPSKQVIIKKEKKLLPELNKTTLHKRFGSSPVKRKQQTVKKSKTSNETNKVDNSSSLDTRKSPNHLIVLEKSPKKLGSPQKLISSYVSPKKISPKLDESPNNKLLKNNMDEDVKGTTGDEIKRDSGYESLSLNSLETNESQQLEPVEQQKQQQQATQVHHTLSSSDSEQEIEEVKTKSNKKRIPISHDEKIIKKVKKLENFFLDKVEYDPKYKLWVDKYRPTSLKQIIGQQGDKSNVNKLFRWLKNWFTNQNGQKKLIKPNAFAKDDSGAYFKAALLSGPPGIGKTTTAHLVCKELNMDIVEFNASDTRSKKSLNTEISQLLTTKSLSPFFNGGGATSGRHVLLMDEVDGMAGNEDRGGVQELILLIKTTKIPIICMCNDRNHPKIRSLGNYCFDLRFSRPRVEQIKGAMMSICFKENLTIRPEQLQQIISSTNQDIRLVLNHLSILAANRQQNMELTHKEIKLGAWDVVRKVFSNEEHKGMSIHDKCDLFFHDYSIAPLFVQENYLNVIPYSNKSKSKLGKMELFASVADSLCWGDQIDHTIRTHSAWALLPTQAVFSSLIPGEKLSGRVGGMINFPTWLGKNSRKNKLDRLSQDIQLHTRLKVSASKEAICTDYIYKLKDGITWPLLNHNQDGVEDALEFLREYNLLREDIESLVELTAWPHIKDTFASIDSKVKAAFTRAYNKHPVMAPFSAAAIKKTRKTRNTEDMQLGDDENLDVEVTSDQDDDDNDLSADAMIIVRKKEKQDTKDATSSKGKGKGKTSKKVYKQ